jgi:ATP/maltotriose-dependent transcriptional regulator MalT
MRGEFDEARDLYARAVATYAEMGHEFRLAARTLVGAEIETLAGDLPAAERELRRGCDILERMGDRGVRSTLSAYLARVLASEGRFNEADELAQFSADTAGSDDLVTQVVWRSARAIVLAHRGERESAEALAAEAAALAADTDFVDLRASALVALAEVLGANGEAAGAADEAAAMYAQKGNVVAARTAVRH